MPYTGRDGLTHQETVIDWDKTLNTKVSMSKPLSVEEYDKLAKSIQNYRKSVLRSILSINPALAGELYSDYVIRDIEHEKLKWDKPLLEGRLVLKETQDNEFLNTMLMVLEKRQEAYENNALSLKTPQVK